MDTGTTAARSAVGRRAFLRTVGITASAAAASTPAAAQEDGSEGGSGNTGAGATDGTIEKGWFDGVGNFDDVVDETGKKEVTVAVGAEGNGGSFAFEPAAVRVDPGTTVIWEWTGEGGGHNVAADGGSFESEIASDAGYTFERAFENEGATAYVCVPHRSMGMRGAVLVGSEATVGGSEAATEEQSSPYGGWLDTVDNFEEVLDKTGEERVEVLVGAQGNGGNFAFSPPAIAIDPGTTVVWKWNENSAALDLVAKDDSFWIDFDAKKETFEWTFADPDVVKYSCPAYEPLGMKGLIVVGNPNAPTPGEMLATPWGMALGGGALMALLSPLAFGAFLFASRMRAGAEPSAARTGRYGEHDGST